MNGVHDMGGMHGFGPVEPEANEPVFHAPWEGRVLAIRRALGAWRKWNIDAGRHSIETLPPADYLRMSYYEKWFASAIKLALGAGLITEHELETGQRDQSIPVATPPLTADKVIAKLRESLRPESVLRLRVLAVSLVVMVVAARWAIERNPW